MNTLTRIARRLRASLRAHRRRWLLAGIPAALVLLGLGTYLVWPNGPDPAAAEVRAYLTAVRDGDVAGALAFTEGSDAERFESDADRRFLSESSLDPDWSIDSVRSTGEVTSDTATAYVTAKISAPGGGSATHTFTTNINDDGSWTIEDPFLTVDFGATPLPYVDANGHKLDVKPVTDDYDPEHKTYLLFPGVYRFYESVPDFIDHDPEPVLLLTGEHHVGFAGGTHDPRTDQITVPPMSLTKSGQKDAQKLVDDYIDDCAKSTKTIEPGCPFGAEYVLIPGRPGYAYDDDSVSDVEWKVADYPVITAVGKGTAFAVTDRERGTVRLSAKGVDDDGTTATSTAECEIISGGLELEVTKQGKLRLYPEGGRSDLDDLDPDPMYWSTCPD